MGPKRGVFKREHCSVDAGDGERMHALRKMSPVDLSEELRQCAGKWVAVKGGRVVEVRETPYALVMALHERGIDDATILRAPASNEPELVGFG